VLDREGSTVIEEWEGQGGRADRPALTSSATSPFHSSVDKQVPMTWATMSKHDVRRSAVERAEQLARRSPGHRPARARSRADTPRAPHRAARAPVPPCRASTSSTHRAGRSRCSGAGDGSRSPGGARVVVVVSAGRRRDGALRAGLHAVRARAPPRGLHRRGGKSTSAPPTASRRGWRLRQRRAATLDLCDSLMA
jgi:hypothetical protein